VLEESTTENDERILLDHINDQRAPLMAAEEYAKGIVYTEALPSSYAPHTFLMFLHSVLPLAHLDAARVSHCMLV
jgi:hypothetical protein